MEPTSPNERLLQKLKVLSGRLSTHTTKSSTSLESLSLGTGNYDEFGNLPPEDELTPHPHYGLISGVANSP